MALKFGGLRYQFGEGRVNRAAVVQYGSQYLYMLLKFFKLS